LRGLKEGEQVIIEGIQRIMPGIPVKPVPYSEQKKEKK
jgi:multidrug efflux pump subunit AcrA (membrane-fusion protein)